MFVCDTVSIRLFPLQVVQRLPSLISFATRGKVGYDGGNHDKHPYYLHRDSLGLPTQGFPARSNRHPGV